MIAKQPNKRHDNVFLKNGHECMIQNTKKYISKVWMFT